MLTFRISRSSAGLYLPESMEQFICIDLDLNISRVLNLAPIKQVCGDRTNVVDQNDNAFHYHGQAQEEPPVPSDNIVLGK